jgi:hypothetical protein
MPEPVQICRGFTDEQWFALRPLLDSGDEGAWRCAIQVFEQRIKERYLSCLDALIAADSKLDVSCPSPPPADCSTLPDDHGKQVVVPGFAILALCCLLAETLQGFREKPAKPAAASGPCTFHESGKCIKPATTDQFREFLRRPAFRGEFGEDDVARSFVNGVRNGIFHEAETRGWLIWREEPPGKILAVEDGRYALNRTEFYRALKAEFEGYLAELRNPTKTDLRTRFKKKMNDIVKES